MVVAVALAVGLGACGKKKPPVARPIPAAAARRHVRPPPAAGAAGARAGDADAAEPIDDDRSPRTDIDEINKNSPFQPVFFAFDSAEVDADGAEGARTQRRDPKKYPTWVITIEGHCDERGTAEYNLALGERRAVAARTYLVSLGIPADRLKTVSYGKEFPFDPGHDEAAWPKNRRAHFVVTSK